jgi:Rrf2 family nitric oxide-sensitive transcriptional repressor
LHADELILRVAFHPDAIEDRSDDVKAGGSAVHGLAKDGYVETVRGKGGGLKLAKPAQDISIGDVVRSTEETLYVVECLADDYAGDCRLNTACTLKSVLRDAQNAFLKTLDGYTLQDLLPKRRGHAVVQFHKPASAPH